MAPTSSTVSRQPPWVLAATGLAAVYCTYLIWSSLSEAPSTGLQRRNALRGQRGTGRRGHQSPRSNRRSTTRSDFDGSISIRDPDAPFGVIETGSWGGVYYPIHREHSIFCVYNGTRVNFEELYLTITQTQSAMSWAKIRLALKEYMSI